jgi:hypothetical protein
LALQEKENYDVEIAKYNGKSAPIVSSDDLKSDENEINSSEEEVDSPKNSEPAIAVPVLPKAKPTPTVPAVQAAAKKVEKTSGTPISKPTSKVPVVPAVSQSTEKKKKKKKQSDGASAVPTGASEPAKKKTKTKKEVSA